MYKVKPRASKRKHPTARKRIWLAKMLCLGAGISFSVAGDGSFAVEPLPAVSSKAEVRSNPFVLPAPTRPGAKVATRSSDSSIMRTSDSQHSELRLRSIGTAVGLVPIGRPRPAQTILEVSNLSESRIQINPLANESAGTFERPVIGMIESAVKSTVEANKSIDTPAQDKAKVDIEPPNAMDLPGNTDSVVFSMTDLDEPSVASADAGASEATEPAIPDNEPIEFVISPPANSPKADSTSRSNVQASQKAELATNEVESERDLECSETNHRLKSLPILPSPNRAWVAAKSESKPNVRSTGVTEAISNPFARYPQRRRAHVEVVPPPMISFESDNDAVATSEGTAKSAKVIPAPIRPARFAGFDQAESSPAQSEGSSNDQQPPRESTGKTAAKVDPFLTEIQEIYPSSRITMTKFQDRLVVHGTCADREEATKIIRLIRSKHLIPVDDKMQIR